MSIFQPVNLAARRAFCPRLPIANDSWWSGTTTVVAFSSSSTSTRTYKYIATESEQIVPGVYYDSYTARDLSPYKKSEEREIVLGGNIMIKNNTQGNREGTEKPLPKRDGNAS